MGDLSEHFGRWEFVCHGVGCCGNSSPVDERLVEGLEELRKLAVDRCGGVEVPIHVDSGFRCRVHNFAVGSADGSLHCLGMAADIWTEKVKACELALLAESVEVFCNGGIGSYDGFVHVDVRRNGPARWFG